MCPLAGRLTGNKGEIIKNIDHKLFYRGKLKTGDQCADTIYFLHIEIQSKFNIFSLPEKAVCLSTNQDGLSTYRGEGKKRP